MSRILKPPPGTPFNYEHPLCPLSSTNTAGTQPGTTGMVLPLWEGSGRPRVYLSEHRTEFASAGTDRLATLTGSVWSGYRSKFGGPTMHAVGNNDLINCGVHTDFIPLNTPNPDAATFIVGYKKTDTNDRYIITTSSNGIAQVILIVLFGGTGKAQIIWGGTTEGTNQLTSGTGFTLGDDVWAFSVGPRGMEIYQNGTLIASNTATPARTSTFHDLQLGVHAFWGSSDLGEYSFVYAYPRQLERAEIQYISADPFCFYDWGEDALKGPSTQTISPTATLTLSGSLLTSTLHKRLYFDSTASAAAAPAFDGSWTSTTGATRRRLNHTKGTSAIASGSRIAWTGTAGNKALDRQYVSNPLDGAQSISGTIKLQLFTHQWTDIDFVDRLYIKVFVTSIDGGTVRGTLLSLNNYGPTSQFDFANTLDDGPHPPFNLVPQFRNKTGADGDAVTLVNALSGDRIVVEIGFSNSTASPSPEASAIYGENNSDAPQDETTTGYEPDMNISPVALAGWIEFSTSLLFHETTQTLSTSGTLTSVGNITKQVGKLFN